MNNNNINKGLLTELLNSSNDTLIKVNSSKDLTITNENLSIINEMMKNNHTQPSFEIPKYSSYKVTENPMLKELQKSNLINRSLLEENQKLNNTVESLSNDLEIEREAKFKAEKSENIFKWVSFILGTIIAISGVIISLLTLL